jgi:1,4-dihydroxy-2-naphthoate octaprenyltransferase
MVAEHKAAGVLWVQGARPRTLPAAIVPVVVGTGVAVAGGHLLAWRAGLAAVVALGLQVGTNYANDYSDGVRGTDESRVGPVRLVASGLSSPGAVKRAAVISFGTAAAAGLVLAAVVSWWLVAVGAAAIAAGWLYTGGPRPYGYEGLGEVFVFVFFGLVATVGTAYVQLDRLDPLAWVAAVAPGLLAVALLVVNNLRDIAGDAAAGKRTLAVRIGAPATRVVYVACLLGPFVVAAVVAAFYRPWALLTLLAVPLALGPARSVLAGAEGRDLVTVLGRTGRVQLAVAVLLAAGLVL